MNFMKTDNNGIDYPTTVNDHRGHRRPLEVSVKAIKAVIMKIRKNDAATPEE